MCANCGEEGHDKLKCPKPRREPGQRPCFRCLKTGHMARDCKAGDPAKSLEAEDARAGDEVTFCLTGEVYDDLNVAESDGAMYFSERHFEVMSDEEDNLDEQDDQDDGDERPSTIDPEHDEELPSAIDDVASEGRSRRMSVHAAGTDAPGEASSAPSSSSQACAASWTRGRSRASRSTRVPCAWRIPKARSSNGRS